MRVAPDTQASWPLFDPLRFALASTVALAHFGVIQHHHAGNFAVQVFFALSGWLIGGILLRTDRKALPRFFYNRVMRIWIPYFLAVVALYAVGAAKTGTGNGFFRFLFYDLTFTHNWFIPKVPDVLSRMPLQGTGAHFWSLAVEEQFYLGAPLLVVLLGWGRSPVVWVAIFLLQFVLLDGWYGSVSLGVGAAALRTRYGDWHERPGAVLGLLAIAVTSLVAIVTGVVPYAYATCVLAISIVLLCARRGPRSKGLLTFLGAMSFPMYLNH